MVNRSNAARPSAWWREPMMWLVLGGPLVVVVASFVTLSLAIRHPDPVLGVEAGEGESGTHQAADFRTGSADAAGRKASMLPALQARNHAATGGR